MRLTGRGAATGSQGHADRRYFIDEKVLIALSIATSVFFIVRHIIFFIFIDSPSVCVFVFDVSQALAGNIGHWTLNNYLEILFLAPAFNRNLIVERTSTRASLRKERK